MHSLTVPNTNILGDGLLILAIDVENTADHPEQLSHNAFWIQMPAMMMTCSAMMRKHAARLYHSGTCILGCNLPLKDLAFPF